MSVTDGGYTWSKLVEQREGTLGRGTLLRMPGGYPYEQVVDFMLFLLDGELALLVASGYKAGHVLQVLPKEALVSNTVRLSRSWLIDNWSRWVDQGSVGDVWICDRIPAPSSLPG